MKVALAFDFQFVDSVPATAKDVPMEEAAFPIEAIVRTLKADGYAGWVTLEPHVAAEFVPEFYARDLSYLRGLLKFRL